MYEQTKDEVLDELGNVIAQLGSDLDSLLWNTYGVDVETVNGAASDLCLPIERTSEGIDLALNRVQYVVDTVIEARNIADSLMGDLDCGLVILDKIAEHVETIMMIMSKPDFKPGDIVSINANCTPNNGLRHERYIVEHIAGGAEDHIWAWLRPLVREDDDFVQVIPGITSRGTVEIVDNLTLLS